MKTAFILTMAAWVAALGCAGAETTFTQVTSGAIVTDVGLFIGAGWGDFNNDGSLDLVVTSWQGQTNAFYRNNGNAIFQATMTNGVPKFSLKAWPGMQFGTQSSTDLAAWAPIGAVTVTNLNGIVQVIDTNPPASVSRFYRAVSQ